MTQCEMVKEALEAGRKITAAMAWKEMGIMRLAARIGNLREDGLDITTETISVRTRTGKARIARYYI